MRTARFQLGWKGGHAEPWGAVHGCGVVLASGRRSDIVSDVVPNNFCPSELADAQTHKHTHGVVLCSTE